MAPALYARYVPPKAVEKKQKEVKETEQVSKTSTPSLYARYAPPKTPAKAAKVVVDENDQSASTSKRKREVVTEKGVKRRKPDDGAVQHDQAVVRSGNHDAPIETISAGLNGANGEVRVEAQSSTSVKASPSDKPKKDKRQKQRKEAPVRDEEADDDTVATKHAGVLSKFQKSIQAASERPAQEEDVEMVDEGELRDLVPIPVPKQPPAPEAFSASAALPSWLAEPVKISKDLRVPLSGLLDDALSKRLRTKGLDQALPVQAGVLPLLLPTIKQHPGDLCISAATGSGKTLSYVLPIVESLKRKPSRNLRAVIVVPTRELVAQVRETAELCTAGSGLRIGTAVGHHAFRNEQEAIVHWGQKYDPAGHRALRARAESRDELDELDDEAEDDFYALLPFHVPEYTSNVDILICTPGRLVDHIKSTKGFSLKHLEWFVIDEADRLLDQSFQEWVEVIQTAMDTSHDATSNENSLLPAYLWPNIGLRPDSWVRKVVLSATMTRDLEKLGSLKLRNPRLVLVEGTQVEESTESVRQTATGDFSLPSTLQEYAVPVGDGSEKPLYLLSLLHQLLEGKDPGQVERKRPMSTLPQGSTASSDTSSVTSSSESDTEDSMSSDDETSSSDDASSVDDDDDDADDSEKDDSEEDSNSDTSDSSTSSDSPIPPPTKPSTTTPSQPAPPTPTPRANALIFTSSTTSALRLSHLLTTLSPPLTPHLSTLTKSSTTSSTRHTLASFTSGHLTLLIATDRAARGLDLPNLGNVINYDIPHSVTSYVHRVGRTARAGRMGRAWTLVAEREAAWFWNVVARGKGEGTQRKGQEMEQRIQRGEGGGVRRVRVEIEGVGGDVRERYGVALEKLRGEVLGEGKGKRN